MTYNFKRNSTTSERIKEAMAIRKMKQIDIVRATGIDKGSISHYVSGKYEPKQDAIMKLAKALNVDEMWLWGYETKMERAPGRDKAEPNVVFDTNKSQGVWIPVLGRVAAGIPINMVTDIIDQEQITEEMASAGEYFALQIHGDSMEPRMKDGDVVIVRQQDDAESGEVVIAAVNGNDATCKRLKKYAEGIMLLSTNSAYEPIVFTNQDIEELPVKILGKVVELRAKF